MNRLFRPTRLFTAAALAYLLVTPSCSTLSDLGGGAGLKGTMKSVATLSDQVGEWTASLSGLPSSGQLDQMRGFTDQAGKLLETLQKVAGGNTDSAVQAVMSGLEEMTGFKVDDLSAMGPDALSGAITKFGDIARNMGDMAKKFLANAGT